MKQIDNILYGAPLGFPLGWIAARITEGKYEVALFDLGMCLALIGAAGVVRTYWRS